MKRIISALFAFLIAAGCGKEEPYINFLQNSLSGEGLVTASLVSVEKVKLEFPSAGGAVSVPFTATSSWSVRLDSDWCSVDPQGGEPSEQITVTVKTDPNISNQQRTCSITVSCGEVNRYISVSQQPAPEPDPDSFSLSPSAVDLGPAGGTFSVSVTSTLPYHISGIPEWITESTVSGTVHSFKAGANDSPEERSGVIVFCSDEGACLPCIVTQAGNGPYIALRPVTAEFGGDGGSLKVDVESNQDWTLSCDSGWFSATPLSGSGNGSVTVSAVANEDVTTRTGTVSFTSASGTSKQLTVVQYGADVFVVSPTETQIVAEACTFCINVFTPRKYSVSIGCDWITESSVQDGMHYFLAQENLSVAPRRAVIEFRDKDGECIPCTVTQEGAISYLTVDASQFDLDEGSARKTISITSNDDWTASSDASWCGVSPSKGTGNGKVTLDIQANPDGSTRRCSVTFSTAGGTVVVVMVKQSRGYQNIDWESEFYHRSLFMRFTATWCVWCPLMHASIVRAMEMYPDKLTPVALHVSSSDLAFSAESPLSSQFHVFGIPTGIVDGRIDIPNGEVEKAAPGIIAASKETESLYGTKTGLEVSSVVSGRDVSVDLVVYAKKAGTYKLTVFLLEDGIPYSQTGAEGGFMIHNDVARIALTAAQGQSFSISGDNSGQSFFFTAKNISQSYDIGKMKVLAYVQAGFGSSPRRQSGDYGDYYVDNSIVVPLGKTLPLLMAGAVSSGQGEGITTGDDIDI